MRLAQTALDQLFLHARTANGFRDEAVPLPVLREVYELARMGPTSLNTQPARYLFLTTAQAKERLLPMLSAGNVEKTQSAPVTVVVATDTRFYEHMPQIWHQAGARERMAADHEGAQAGAQRNTSLSAAYFMLAARALGLDCGPMGGFDGERLNAEFFPDGRYRVSLLINLGYADADRLRARNPRLDFEQACAVL
ncbi:MAG: malonic semialdehyde reductase [Hylemonella sp.]|nr:malonic semialdehyde reductase [Hylemonella sp.]